MEEYRNNQNFKNNTIYNYFSMQLVRSPGTLLNAYDAFEFAKELNFSEDEVRLMLAKK